MRPRRTSSFVDVAPHITDDSAEQGKERVIESLEILNKHIINVAAVLAKTRNVPKKNKIEVIKEKVIIPLTKSNFGKTVVFFSALLNIFLMFSESEVDHSRPFILLEWACLFIIIIQIILKIMYNKTILDHSFWIYFDIFNAIVSFLYLVTPETSLLHAMLQYLRLALIVRLIELYRPSRSLVVAMAKTTGITVAVIVLTLIFAFLSAYIGCSLFHSHSSYNTFGESLYTIFIVLMQSGLPGYHTITPTQKLTFGIFYIIVSFIGSFVIMNVLTGVSYLSFLKEKRDEQKKYDLLEQKRQVDESNRAVVKRLVSKSRKEIQNVRLARKLDPESMRVAEHCLQQMRDKTAKMIEIVTKIEEIADAI